MIRSNAIPPAAASRTAKILLIKPLASADIFPSPVLNSVHFPFTNFPFAQGPGAGSTRHEFCLQMILALLVGVGTAEQSELFSHLSPISAEKERGIFNWSVKIKKTKPRTKKIFFTPLALQIRLENARHLTEFGSRVILLLIKN